MKYPLEKVIKLKWRSLTRQTRKRVKQKYVNAAIL